MIIKLEELPEQGMTFEGTEPPELLSMEESAEFHPVGPLT